MNTDDAGRDRLDIDNMYLCGSRLTRVSLKDSFFGDAHFVGVTLNDVNASGMTFENVNLSGARLNNVNVSGMTLSNANLSGAVIAQANYDGATLDGILITDLLDLWRATHGET